MAKNIFLDKNQATPRLKRNSFDKSKLVNGTYRSGFIYPVDWEEVTFGDSIKLDLSAGLRTMPMVWPIQTPIIAKFYTFYVRFRNLQKNFMDFRFNNKSIVHPYIALSSDADFWKTGELGDHLGIPTTYASDHNLYTIPLISPHFEGEPSPRNYPIFYSKAFSSFEWDSDVFSVLSSSYTETSSVYFPCRLFGRVPPKFASASSIKLPSDFIVSDFSSGGYVRIMLVRTLIVEGLPFNKLICTVNVPPSLNEDGTVSLDLTSGTVSYNDGNSSMSGGLKSFLGTLIDSDNLSNADYSIILYDTLYNSVKVFNNTVYTHFQSNSVFVYDTGTGIVELKDVSNPFSGSNPVIPLSALIPRAYEQIYNYYFRDLINEPFLIDGEPQFNRFITTDEDGADYTDYKLKRRNWEADPFTSARPC